MRKEEISRLVSAQRAFFDSGATLSPKFRREALIKLKKALIDNEKAIADALFQDLGKCSRESYMCETGLVISEISHTLKHLKSYTRDKRVKTPLSQFCSKSYVKPCPYGNVLIMSPWNYPLLLTLSPLVNALSAGNTAIIKPSAYAPATASLIKDITDSIFAPEYVVTITGAREENSYLLCEKFDYIFFTGSKGVGKLVLEKAAQNLTPVTLELGGKSPCIVDSTANLPLAAKRIVFGKFLNCGQTCVAPDYILCDASVKDSLKEHIIRETERQYTNIPLENDTYGKIINEKHFNRLIGLIDESKTVHGGKWDKESLKIEPTVMDGVNLSDPVMKEEIFGPLLPILTFRDTDEAIRTVKSGDKPLALYIFTSDKATARKITESVSYGGGCINDVVIHLATSEMGFGGVGESGMGAYHGKAGFDTFTHYKSIVDKKTFIDLPMRYHPLKASSDKLIRFFLK